MSTEREHCPINRCGRPFGVGTHMAIGGYGLAPGRTVQVCEDHWQALRTILPLTSDEALDSLRSKLAGESRG